MHWIDQIAKKLSEKNENNVIASGISISGHIHIGHSNDVFIADAVKRVLKKRGLKAVAIWYADDFDPLRRVPWPLPEKDYKEYLGYPYVDIPSPDPEHENFVEFFRSPFVDSLDEFGVKPKIYSSAEVYRSGKLAEQTRTALENSEEIRKILNEYKSNPLPEDWLPYDPICEECGRISTTRALNWEGNHVTYECTGTNYVDGCGHEGKADFTRGEGKLTWRVEWPARWKMLGVTCEPFGKDHAASGGSYDTGKLISERIFDHERPEPIPYEWISLKGKPLSSSKGRVFRLSDWLEVADPELLRFLLFRSKALKAKDFDPELPLLELYQEYRQAEDVYFGMEETGKSDKEQIDRIYELSQVDQVPERYPQRIPIRLAVIMIQVARDYDQILDILSRKGVIEDPEEWEVKMAKERLKRAENWVEKYAPDRTKLKVLEKLPEEAKEELSEKQKRGLYTLSKNLEEKEVGPVDIHNRIYEVARDQGLKPVKMFQAIYTVLLGQKSGPRAGNFLTALEDEFVIKRFREAVK